MPPATTDRADPPQRIAWPFALLACLLGLASLHNDALGAAWALFVFTGLWPLRRGAWRQAIAPLPPFLKLWLLAALLSLAAKGLATLYWQDPWGERHGEIRMLLGAMACVGVWGYWQGRPEQRHLLLIWISQALTLTSAMGLVWVLWYGRTGLTTHPIPWAGIMAMFSCWLLAVGLDKAFSLPLRMVWLTGSLSAVLAVLASQSRGAYLVAGWWIAVLAWQGSRQRAGARRTARMVSLSAAGVAVALTAMLWYTPVLERTRLAVQEAVSEAQDFHRAAPEAPESSVGARLYLWQHSLQAIAQAPWLGHGHDGRKQLLKQWADDAQSGHLRQLGHVHNEYLHQLMDHGLPGLLSQAALLAGLLYAAWLLRASGAHTAALALTGMWLVYATGNLSNVNFAHNYYTAGLSLMTSLSLVLLQVPIEPQQQRLPARPVG